MKTEVIVVGAGPAGSTAAKFLAEKGVNVVLIDKEVFPRDKPCGGGLPLRALQRYPYIKDSDIIESYSYGGCGYTAKLTKVEVQKDEPLIAMVLRKKFDAGLVKFAIDCGADFIGGKAVKDITVKPESVEIKLNDGTLIESKVVIGSDGYSSTIAKKTGLRPKKEYIAVCVCEEIPLNKEIIEQFFTEKRLVHFHTRFQGINGYGWLFPKEQHINIGIGEYPTKGKTTQKKRPIKENYNQYFNFLKEQKLIPEFLKIGNLRGGVVPLWPLKKTYSDRVILCGDAAGLVNPVTAEGIYYAMASGELAANTIVKALEVDDFSDRFLSRYQRAWKNDFGKDLTYLLSTTKRLDGDTDKFFNVVNKDDYLSNMLLGIMSGQLSPHEYRWKIIKRYIYLKIRGIFQTK